MNKKAKYGIPDLDKILWRYMDLSKFLDILNSSSIYYSGLDSFDDIFEGSLTHRDAFSRSMKQKYGTLTFDSNEIPLPIFNNEEKLIQKRNTRVSCWHINSNESLAMWKLYLLSHQGIVIKTTVEEVMKMTDKSELDFYNGLVSYHDYRKDISNSFKLIDRVFQKRIGFEHEKEFRSVHLVQDGSNHFEKDSFKIKCDLNQLIKKIVLAPKTPEWYSNMLKETIKKFGYSFLVEKSEFEDLVPF